jgi:DNA-binding NtrC family response regulator
MLQRVYQAAGTTRNFTGTYAFLLALTSEFKRRLIEATPTQSGGNRTRGARALGLQRTYPQRLMREFELATIPSRDDILAAIRSVL